MISSVYATSANSIQQHTEGLRKEAENIARATKSSEMQEKELAESLIKAKQHLRGVQASSHVIEVTDRAIGHLIDVLV